MNDNAWIQYGKEYVESHSAVTQGKTNRFFTEQDLAILGKEKVVACIRPRGVLSGFLAIVPKGEYAVFRSPKTDPIRIWMRLHPSLQKGAIFLAYLVNTTVILEDVLVWKNEPVWLHLPFEERWNSILKEFRDKFIQDPLLQGGVRIEFANYLPLSAVEKPKPNFVIEFVRNMPKQKRILFLQDSVQPTAAKKPEGITLVKKDVSAGPDVYTVFRSGEKSGYALVKTLAISRALRNAKEEEIRVEVEWNKHFGKWEILQVF